jgi:hypothetical protein
VNIFGSVHFQTSVQWLVTNGNLTLRGVSQWTTQVEYTGGPMVNAVLFVNGASGVGGFATTGLNGLNIANMFFYGGVVNATDGVLLKFVNHSRIDSVDAWGVINCGIETQGGVTDTLIQPRVSSTDALFIGIDNASHTQPANGLCLGGITNAGGVTGNNIDTTSGSVIDGGFEGLSNIGVFLESADQESFHGGTSESNKIGIFINPTASGVNSGVSNKTNVFTSMDIEDNSLGTAGVDITDSGADNTFINILSSSPCSGCQALSLTGGHDYVLNGTLVTGMIGAGANGISIAGFTATSGTAGSASALPSLPVGYIVEQINGANVKIPYYGN